MICFFIPENIDSTLSVSGMVVLSAISGTSGKKLQMRTNCFAVRTTSKKKLFSHLQLFLFGCNVFHTRNDVVLVTPFSTVPINLK